MDTNKNTKQNNVSNLLTKIFEDYKSGSVDLDSAIDSIPKLFESDSEEVKPSPNYKKLIQLRTKLKFYQKLSSKMTKIMNAELDLEDYDNEVFHKVIKFENELDELKMKMDLADEEWDEDEN